MLKNILTVFKTVIFVKEIYIFIKERIFKMSKYIELVTAIAGVILAFIPDNNYLKAITMLVTAIVVGIIRFYKVINENKKLKEEAYRKIDSNLLKEIKKLLYGTERISYMRQHDFASPFSQDFIDPLMDYWHESDNNPEFVFLDSELNDLKKKLDHNISEFITTLSFETFDLDVNPNFRAVPKEWREEQPERFKRVVNKANNHATKVVETYTELIQVARKKMIDF